MTRRLTAVGAALLCLGGAVALADPANASPGVLYTNSLVAQRADPHIVRHTDGFYYLTATVPE